MSSAPKGPKRPALGRGLSSLIQGAGGPGPASGPAQPPGRRILQVPIEQIQPRADQPRSHFEEGPLLELAASIEAHGVLLPLLVTKGAGIYLLIAGERRWRAAQRAGLKEVPVLIEEADEDEAFELALIENIQRSDLNPIEEAEAYQRLRDRRGWTQEELAEAVGRDRATVANALRLLRLAPPAREAVVQGQISMGHARALLGLEAADAQGRALREVISRGLSVRQTEALVRSLREGRPTKAPPPPQSAAIRDLSTRIERHLGAKVSIKDKGGRGSLKIDYDSLETLDRILELILPE